MVVGRMEGEGGGTVPYNSTFAGLAACVEILHVRVDIV